MTIYKLISLFYGHKIIRAVNSLQFMLSEGLGTWCCCVGEKHAAHECYLTARIWCYRYSDASVLLSGSIAEVSCSVSCESQ
jgi:hypothetical protein